MGEEDKAISGLDRLRQMQAAQADAGPGPSGGFVMAPRGGSSMQMPAEPEVEPEEELEEPEPEVEEALEEEDTTEWELLEEPEEEPEVEEQYEAVDEAEEVSYVDAGDIEEEDVAIQYTHATDDLPLLVRIRVLQKEIEVLSNAFGERKGLLDELEERVNNLSTEEAYENRCKANKEGNNCQKLEGHLGPHMGVWYVFTGASMENYKSNTVEWED